MIQCPCNQCPMTGASQRLQARPRLFNWMTIVLLTAWVAVVAVVAETTALETAPTMDTRTFIQQLL